MQKEGKGEKRRKVLEVKEVEAPQPRPRSGRAKRKSQICRFS